MTTGRVDVQGYLAKHEQDCWRRRLPAHVTFDFFQGDDLVKSETYLIDSKGRSVLAREPSKTGQPRYAIHL